MDVSKICTPADVQAALAALEAEIDDILNRLERGDMTVTREDVEALRERGDRLAKRVDELEARDGRE